MKKSDPCNHILSLIKDEIKNLNLSQTVIAEKMEIKSPYLSRMLNGIDPMSQERLTQILEFIKDAPSYKIIKEFIANSTKPPHTFEYGDTVRLRSGGPLMTVTGPSSKYETACVWFVGKELHSGTIHPKALIKDTSGLAALIEDQTFHRRLAALERQVFNQGGTLQ